MDIYIYIKMLMTNLLCITLLPQHPQQIDEDLQRNKSNGVDGDNDDDNDNDDVDEKMMI